MLRASSRFRIGAVIGALAVATAAGPSMFAQAAGAGPSSAQVSQHDQLIQAAQACHQLALFQIKQGQTDAQTTRQSREAYCKSTQTVLDPNPGCFTTARDAYNATLLTLQQQRFSADGVFQKESDGISYAFSNINACPQACSAGMRQIYTQPAAQLSCSQLASLLGVSTTPTAPQ